VAVILSGAGADRAEALHGIREAGVTVFAQELGVLVQSLETLGWPR
jgi:chemotaxis response regulator CheB